MSTLPNSAIAASTRAWQSSGRATPVRPEGARGPAASTACWVSASRSTRRAPRTTSAPASASVLANTAPSPDDAPVTIATLSSSRNMSRIVRSFTGRAPLDGAVFPDGIQLVGLLTCRKGRAEDPDLEGEGGSLEQCGPEPDRRSGEGPRPPSTPDGRCPPDLPRVPGRGATGGSGAEEPRDRAGRPRRDGPAQRAVVPG